MEDSLFVVGTCTPDLVSIFDRNVRFKESSISKRVQNSEVSPEQMSFYQGVIRHFQVDRIFHSSDFFHTETRQLASELREAFPATHMKRSFFVAHVLLELVLDRLLIAKDEMLLSKFYAHFERCPNEQIVALTRWLTGGEPLPAYSDFVRRFTEDKHLYRYQEMDYIIYVLKRILRRVGIFEYDYLNSQAFLYQVQQYEQELGQRFEAVLEDFQLVLAKS
jgi:acyl carrier protein phosphodiesterase